MPVLTSRADGPLTHSVLKAHHRQVRESHPDSLSLRIHRALSWLNRAEQAADVDGKFIFLWISFNAAYAQELDDSERMSDQFLFMAFLEKLCDLDIDRHLHDLIWNEFSGSIRTLLDNPYVYHPFWEFQRGRIDEDEWKRRFEGARKMAQRALANSDTPLLLSIAFRRLYMLRKLVPVIISLMMTNPNTLWGDAVYPVVN